MTAKPHVIVVGAGIVGASIAWHLTRKGAAVTVVGEELGGVATPCSFAWINASWGNPEFYFHFRRRAMAEWKLLQSGGQIVGVVTSAGMHEADYVVLAAGAGAVPIAASAGITLPLSTPAGLIVHSRPVSKRLNGLVMTPRLHMRQTAEGRIIAGTDFGGGDPGKDHQASAAELFARVKAMIADNGDLTFDFFTVGYRPTPADGFPIIGNAGRPGLYFAVMHSGVTLAPLAGLLVADELLSDKTDESLMPFRLQRFTDRK